MPHVIEIVGINGTPKRVIKESIRIIDHPVRDAVNGKEIMEKYVEMVVVGHRGQWKEWVPLNLFKKLNPEVKL